MVALQEMERKEAWDAMRQDLKLDYEACSGGLATFQWSFLVHPGFQVSLCYRLARMFHLTDWMFMAKVMCVVMRWLTHCDIHHGAMIGPGVQFPHGCGVVIGEGVQVGPKCSLFQHTTMGAIEGVVGAPCLAEGVNLYPGTVLAGDVQIGEYCRIGPNVYLTESVPSHTRVSPPKPNLARSDVSI
jgi:serine O-acetyltransferase